MSNHFNLLKSGWVTVNAADKRIINSDERLAAKWGKESNPVQTGYEETSEEVKEGFVDGLFAEQVHELLGEEGVVKVRDQAEGSKEEERYQALIKQAEEELALAQIQIVRMKEEAEGDIEVMKRVAAEEAKGKGYAEGFEKGVAEIEKLRAGLREEREKLQREYEQRVDELEPQFVELITDIYEQVFRVELKPYGPIVAHLISNTMRNSEEKKDFIIHVSKADYEEVSSRREEIKENGISGKTTVEIIEDITLLPGECMIETGGGIFDCGLGTQLACLKEKLKLLSFEK